MGKERSRTQIDTKTEAETIDFAHWFVGKTDAGQLRPHHLHTVRAFFTAIGVPDKAERTTFDQALKKYGI